MNNKGQSILSEHVMVFFVVIAALVAMTTFVQRAFEARVHDERNFMVDAVIKNSAVCDANCLQATGGVISHEYEPYYAQMVADTQQNENDNAGLTNGSAQEIGSIDYKSINEETRTNSISVQLPPGCVNGGC